MQIKLQIWCYNQFLCL